MNRPYRRVAVRAVIPKPITDKTANSIAGSSSTVISEIAVEDAPSSSVTVKVTV